MFPDLDLLNSPGTLADSAETRSTQNVDPIFTSADLSMPDNHQPHTEDTTSLPRAHADRFGYERLIRVYYRDIHPAHPIVLPQKMYLQDRNVLPDYLKTVMAFMASHLVPEVFEGLRERAESVFEPGVPDDGFKVQALLLLTLTSYARFERDRGNKALSQATTLATRIGMDRNSFNEYQSPAYRESWRRTYWELFTVTGLISLIAGVNYRIRCPDDLFLPGHCENYNDGRSSEVRDLQTMRNRVPMNDGFKWSSSAYKIEAMRIMASVFECESLDGALKDAKVQALSASVTSFLLSLPEEKQTPLTIDGDIDEVMSCALMIINLAGVCLHFPRSSLAGKASFNTVCGNDRREKVESQDERFHRAAAIKYANGLSKLISSRPSLRTLTPCFSCSIAFAAAVHLAAVLPRDNSEAQHKEHIQLELSALNIVAAIWPIGGVVRSQLGQYAREVLSCHPIQAVLPPIQDSNPSALSSLPNGSWLTELTSQDTDITSEGFLFNLLDPSQSSMDHAA